MTDAAPRDTAPRYLLRDRDKSYGPAFCDRVRAMGIEEIVTAARSRAATKKAVRALS
jgi:putative transposase